MTTKTPGKVGRPSRSLDDEIAATALRLDALKARKRELERVERERNQKSILGLIRSEALDEISVEVWREVLPGIRRLLNAPQAPKVDPSVGTNAEPQAGAGRMD
jgi:hypothetical protein